MKLKHTQIDNEHGFSLIELLVVFIVVSVLIAIIIPVLNGQQRLAQIASLQSDVRNSIKNLVNPDKPFSFNSSEKFLKLSNTSSPENILGVTMYKDNNIPVACVWGIREFSPSDIVSFHYFSDTGVFSEGVCNPTETPQEVIKENTNPPVLSSPPLIIEQRPSVPFEINGTYTEGNITYTPEYQYNSYGKGSATIRIHITSTSPVMENWSYKADLVKAPYFNATSTSVQFNDGQGVISFPSSNSLQIDAINQWNGVSKNRSITVTYNLTSFIPPDVPDYYTVTVTKDETPWSMWHACISVKVTGTSNVPVTWSETIDLKDYFASLGNRKVDFVNLNKINKGDNVFIVSGNHTNSDFVSPIHPVNNSQTICYNPEGNKAFK